jgi:2-dehydro-3-deoxyglucarate aldolase/4-hydroxy-2-oxoheptanedioate aldolase
MTENARRRSTEQESATFRERLTAGEPLVGTFLNLGSPVSAEICAIAGYDWVLIDLEHGSGSQAELLGQLQAVDGSGCVPLVRVELSARTPVSRALDPGAAGIMFPRIESAAEAREAVRFLRFPPDGVRGVAAQNRAGRFGSVALSELGRLDDDLVGVVQVETLGAIEDLDAIAAVEGVDVLFVGPGDLSYALGIPGRLDDPRYIAALDAVVGAAAAHGCAAGVLVRDVEEADRHLSVGFRFIGIGSDSSLIMSGARATVSAFRAAAALTATAGVPTQARNSRCSPASTARG